MNFELEPLPFAKAALVPHLGAETLELHYEKHHRGYLTRLQELIGGTPEAQKSLEEIVKTSSGAVFNNAAQIWNHDFYWKSMKPNGGAEPSGLLAEAIKKDFGSYATFKTKFQETAVGVFGTGWAWLVHEGGKLAIVGTGDAETPMSKGTRCLLACDVWEHAYYLDYKNQRPKYVETWLNSLVNWDFAMKNFQLTSTSRPSSSELPRTSPPTPR